MLLSFSFMISSKLGLFTTKSKIWIVYKRKIKLQIETENNVNLNWYVQWESEICLLHKMFWVMPIDRSVKNFSVEVFQSEGFFPLNNCNPEWFEPEMVELAMFSCILFSIIPL